MDRHTHLLASILQTCTMLHPDDPKAAVEHANRILDQVELCDQERFTRPLAAELDEELQDLQDDLLPDPGDMVPVNQPETGSKDAPAAIRDWVESQNEQAVIGYLESACERLTDRIDRLETNVLFDKTSDFYEEVMAIKASARIMSRVFQYRKLHEATRRTRFVKIEDLSDYAYQTGGHATV